jgi:hypothetical protein
VGSPFYLRLNELVDLAGFDEFCEAGRCNTIRSWVFFAEVGDLLRGDAN